MILLDTNVISEMMRPIPSAAVDAWMNAQTLNALWSCAPVMAELRYGVVRLAESRRRADLLERYAAIKGAFAQRLLGFDVEAAEVFADIVAHRSRIGRPVGQMDAAIAAIARNAGAAVATRDVRGFEDCGVALIDPWRGP